MPAKNKWSYSCGTLFTAVNLGDSKKSPPKMVSMNHRLGRTAATSLDSLESGDALTIEMDAIYIQLWPSDRALHQKHLDTVSFRTPA